MFGFGINLKNPAGAPGHGPAIRRRRGTSDIQPWQRDNAYLRALRKRLARGDFASAETAIAAQNDVNDRAYVVEACADWASPPAWIDRWSERHPESGAMYMVRGVHGVISAWLQRGVDWVPNNVGGFWDRLRSADEDLKAAARLRPSDAVPWAYMIAVAKGLQLGSDEAGMRFREAVRRDPGIAQAYTAMLSVLCAKWGGSDSEMFDFARRASSRAPGGSTIHALVATAHLEFTGSLLRSQGEQADRAYWHDPAVRHELRSAAQKCFLGIGPRGRTASGRSSIDHARAAMMFGATLDSCGDHQAGQQMLALLR